MKRSLIKELLRDFWRNKSRFLSILAIVALGAGFFGGLKATSTDMKRTVDDYYKEQHLMDFRVVSTLGLTDADAADIRALDGVAAAAPAYRVDAILSSHSEEDGQRVMRVHSLTEEDGINQCLLLEGRLPQKADEAVVITSGLVDSNYQIGDSITIDTEADEEAAEALTIHSFTIVGFVRNPVYISTLGASSTKGNGKVSNYMYVLPEAFAEQPYSEIYVRGDFSDTLYTFGEEYTKKASALEQVLTQLSDAACERRRDEVIGTAEEELDSARKTYEEEKANAEKQFAEAEAQLNAAQEKITSGRVELAQNQAAYESGIAEGERQLAEAQKALESGEEELDSAKLTLDETKTQLDLGKIELDKGKSQLDAAEAEWQSGKNALDLVFINEENAQRLLSIAQDAYDKAVESGNETLISAAAAGLSFAKRGTDGYAELAEARKTLDEQQSVYQKSLSEYTAGLTAYQNGLAQYRQGRETLKSKQAEYESGRQTLAEQKESGAAQLAAAQEKLRLAEQTLSEQRAAYEEKKAEAESELSAAYEKLLDAQEQIDALASPEWILQSRSTDTTLASFEQDADRVDAIATVFPAFFFLVAALVSLTTMTRMVEEQRTQFGVLKALGYSNGVIMSKYLIFAVVTALIGAAVGLSVGFVVFPKVIWMAYSMMYAAPPVETPVDWGLALLSTGIFLIATLIASYSACRKELKTVPAGLIRPKAPKSGKRVLLERITPIWKCLSFTQKLTVRNIFRDKKRFFMTIIGVAGCMALVLTGFGLKDSIGGLADKQFGTISHYDLNIILSHKYDENAPTERQERLLNTLSQDSDTEASLLYMQQEVTASAASDSMSVYLFVPQSTSQLDTFITMRRRGSSEQIALSDGGAVITEKMASELSLSVGDTLTIAAGDDPPCEVKITGITENYVYHYIYLTPAAYREAFGKEPSYQLIYTRLSDTSDEAKDRLTQTLLENKEVMSLTFTADLVETLDDTFDRLNLIVFVLIISASLLAFVVLYNLTNINITERVREIATIKVLGFYDREVDAYIFRENIILTIAGTAVGTFLGILLHQFVVHVAEVNYVMFSKEISPLSYLLSVLITVGFAVLVQIVMHRRLSRITMVESLKSVE